MINEKKTTITVYLAKRDENIIVASVKKAEKTSF